MSLLSFSAYFFVAPSANDKMQSNCVLHKPFAIKSRFFIYDYVSNTQLFWSQRFYFGVGTQKRKLRAFVFEERSSLLTAKLSVSTWRFEEIIFLKRCTDLIYGILSCSY